MPKIKGFYFITDSGLSRKGIYHDVKEALKAGVKIVQYREKDKTSLEMYGQALKLRGICKNVSFIINDRLDIALAVDADGIHLGQSDLPYKTVRKIIGKNKIIGVTVHSLKEALIAQKEGADYLGVSPIFSTKTKKDAGIPKGIKLIREIKAEVKIPLVAIGGINLKNASLVVKAGADSLCVISAVLGGKDTKNEIIKFNNLIKSL